VTSSSGERGFAKMIGGSKTKSATAGSQMPGRVALRRWGASPPVKRRTSTRCGRG